MAVLDVNCRGPLLLVHTFVPHMVARGRALWVELAPFGVDVLAVQPGSTRTPRLTELSATRAPRPRPARDGAE